MEKQDSNVNWFVAKYQLLCTMIIVGVSFGFNAKIILIKVFTRIMNMCVCGVSY